MSPLRSRRRNSIAELVGNCVDAWTRSTFLALAQNNLTAGLVKKFIALDNKNTKATTIAAPTSTMLSWESSNDRDDRLQKSRRTDL